MNELTFCCPACGFGSYENLYEKNHCTIIACRCCGLGRTNIPNNFDLASIYDESYFAGGQSDGYTDYIGSETVLRREFAKSVSLLRKHCPDGGKVLELGCAYGFFLSEASAFYDVAGVEISRSAADFARNRGLNVLDGVADDDNLSRIGNVDAIVMLDVIEHLPDPYETLLLCKKYLNPSGVIIFTTGDFGSLYARMTGRNWRLMTPPQHLSFFTKESVQHIAKRLGMKMERFDHPWKTVPLDLILYQLPRIIGLKSTVAPQIGGSVGLPVNLFDAMRAVLQKK